MSSGFKQTSISGRPLPPTPTQPQALVSIPASLAQQVRPSAQSLSESQSPKENKIKNGEIFQDTFLDTLKPLHVCTLTVLQGVVIGWRASVTHIQKLIGCVRWFHGGSIGGFGGRHIGGLEADVHIGQSTSSHPGTSKRPRFFSSHSLPTDQASVAIIICVTVAYSSIGITKKTVLVYLKI